ncbi:MAG: uracil-DNA glycosylase family protein [Planctomycetota bacterium]
MPKPTKTAQQLIDAARELSDAVGVLRFAEPVTHVYNPLTYAGSLHEQYLARFGRSRKRVVLLGMNPGPWGMAQTGVPFGEVAAVRDWMKLAGNIKPPESQHEKRPVTGLACPRSEVSGRRVWELVRERFDTPDAFANDCGGHFVSNYCPLVFMEASGKNRTPDKLPAHERAPLEAACDAHLRRVVDVLRPAFLVGVGKFAEAQAKRVLSKAHPDLTITTVLHPSPASPLANRGWAPQATAQLIAAGVWS